MSWTCRLSKDAVKQLRRLPRDRRQQLAQAIEEMAEDPTGGDVRPIKSGKFKGALRKHVERHRIIFSIDTTASSVEIAAILARTGATYR